MSDLRNLELWLAKVLLQLRRKTGRITTVMESRDDTSEAYRAALRSGQFARQEDAPLRAVLFLLLAIHDDLRELIAALKESDDA